MSPENKAELFSLITALYISKSKPIVAGTHEVWLMDLQEFPIDKLREAFRIERRDDTHEWPMVAHVIAHLDSTESDALKQFSLIEKSNCWHPDIGWSGAKPWNDIADRSLREIGGIGSVMDATEKSLPFLRKEFVSAYERNKNIKRIELPNLEATARNFLEEK